ncbi:MAG: hypothetical protein ACJA2W_003846 [Planctomycetota bacterium]|jgi:hypothetical protein
MLLDAALKPGTYLGTDMDLGGSMMGHGSQMNPLDAKDSGASGSLTILDSAW